MKSIFKVVGLPILATILACRPPSTEIDAQDAAQRAQSLEQQLIGVQQSILELREELHKVTQKLIIEKATSREAVVKLETENAALERRCEHMERDLAELVRSEAEAMAALRAAQDMVAALMKERDRMRAEQAAKPPPKAAADPHRQEDQAGRPQVVREGEPDDPFGVAPAPEPDDPFGIAPAPEPDDPFGVTPAPEPDDPFGVTPAPEPDDPSVSRPPAPDHDLFGSPPARPDRR